MWASYGCRFVLVDKNFTTKAHFRYLIFGEGIAKAK
jgi:hypothetical protein